jgi:hypothetical protein
MTIRHFEFTRAQFSHHIVHGQAVKQLTNTSCPIFHKELILLLYKPEERYSASDADKDTSSVKAGISY